jgi:hypothetical protein
VPLVSTAWPLPGQLYNPGPRVVYVLFGPGEAGPSRFTVKLQPGTYFEPAEAWAGREVTWWEDFPPEGLTIWDRLLLEDS